MFGQDAKNFLTRERRYEQRHELPEPEIFAARAASPVTLGRAPRPATLILGDPDAKVLAERVQQETDAAQETLRRKIEPRWLTPDAVDGPVLAYLRKYTNRKEKRTPILLVHGASAWRATFMEPNGGLMKRLLDAGYEVWTLDWRCSKSVTDPWKGKPATDVPRGLVDMSLDDAAESELPAAVRKINQENQPPLVVGHCMGAAITAMAIAKGLLTSDRFKPTNDTQIAEQVVLSTIGLFYRAGVDSWFRANERLDGTEPTNGRWYLYPGEASWSNETPPAAVGPGRKDKSEGFEQMFTVWQRMPYRHCKVAFCQRISSMLGTPYRPDDIGYLHDTPSSDDPAEPIAGLAGQFGVMPLSFLYHCAQNVRRGWVAPLDGPESDQSYLNAEPFGAFKTTLITGSENQLWYRDSVDRMAEWLGRRVGTLKAAPFVEKKIFQGFGHQDLWWSERAAEPGSVYEYVTKRIADWKKPDGS